jgi:cold shock protein
MATGVIRWFHENRGYGFIEADNSDEFSEPLYVHHTEILGRGYRSLRAGQSVRFHIQQADGHKRAVEVEAL